MKKIINFSVMLVAASILFSSCIGSFQLTTKLKNYNDNIGSKWVNELVFVAFCIVPVYELAALADALVINSIEFWTGKKTLADAGETKVIKNSKFFSRCFLTLSLNFAHCGFYRFFTV